MADEMVMQAQDEEWASPVAKLELGILVLDGSGSMRGAEPGSNRAKADMVELHLIGDGAGPKSLVQRLKESTRLSEIQLAVVTFDHRVRRALDPAPVAEIDPAGLHLELLQQHGGATAIGLALKEAGKIANDFVRGEEEGIPRYALILLMTDGREEGPQKDDPSADPVKVAEEIKALAQTQRGRPEGIIASVAYGAEADEATLQKLVTSPLTADSGFFKKVRSGEELREFFMQSMQVVDKMST